MREAEAPDLAPLIRATHAAKLESDNPALTCSDVGVAHNAGFKLQIVQAVLTTSPMLMIPASLPLWTTGMWRARCRVIRSIT